MKKRYFFAKEQGFTLVELVIVILIIAIISIVALPSWQGNEMTLEYEARRVVNDVRYTQTLSMTTGQRYRWVQTSTSTYQITNESGTPQLLSDGSTTATLSSGVVFGTLGNLPNSLVAYDSQGIPYTTSTYPGTALGATATIPLTNGTRTRTVSIVQTTGYGSLQ